MLFYFALLNIRDRFAGGDWAGNAYQDSGCPSTCVGMFCNPTVFLMLSNRADVQYIDFVNNNPASFKDAYFDFASIRTFIPASGLFQGYPF